MVPLSFAQQRLWLIDRLEGPNAVYNIPMVLRLTGPLDAAALRAALDDLLERHESLRTVFPATDGVPRQEILEGPAARAPFGHRPLREADLAAELTACARHPFDLAAELPVRADLFTLAPEVSVLSLVIHHIANDGWSTGPLFRDLRAAYTARLAGAAPDWEPLPVQYADYALWQREVLGEEDDPHSELSLQSAYWRDRLAGLPDQLALPFDRPRPASSSHRGDAVDLEVPRALWNAVAAVGRAAGASSFMVLQAAFALLLTRLGAGTDIPLGTVTAGRGDEALEDLVGFFVNTLVLRTDTSGNPGFRTLLDRVRQTALGAYTHQDLPFERIVEILNPPRSLARHPVFQVMLVFHQNAGDSDFELPGLTVDFEPGTGGAAKFDLTLTLAETLGPDGAPGGLVGHIHYATDLFERATVERMGRQLLRVLEAVAADPSVPLDSVPLLSGDERHRLLVAWNGQDTAPPGGTVPQLFAGHAAATPGAPAVIDGATVLTYRELDERANRLAHLLTDRGVGPETLVAVALPRCADAVVALLAVWKAGGGYVPLDPAYPAERLAVMLADARPLLLLTTTGVTVPPGCGVPDLRLDSPRTTEALATAPATAPRPRARPGNPAYVIFTSGSTGRPKGVVVAHSALADYVTWCARTYPSITGTALLHTSLSFDLTVTGLWGPLAAGGCVLLASLTERDPAEAVHLPAHPVTFLKATPSHLPLLAEAPAAYSPSGELLIGGEILTGEALRPWRTAHPATVVRNVYGPTEITVNCAEYRLLPGSEPPPGILPVGRPQANIRLYVLDAALNPVPQGVAGELYAAGTGLARGYLDRPAATAQRFTACPFGPPGARMYRTGDLARWNADAQLEVLGRADQQVKVRGFRIEPGEIEAVLAADPRVAQVAVVVREDTPGDRRLVAYAVPTGPDATVESAALRALAARALPDYMVPATVVTLPALPLTANGKLDRSALPAPGFTAGPRHRAPATAVQAALCDLFARVLGRDRDQVGTDDGFFDLGGHSLLAARLIGLIDSSFGARLRMRDLFETPTVAGLAARLETGERPADGDEPFGALLPVRARGSGRPLFCLHPGSGIGWSYTGLLPHLDPETPVYALQSPALSRDTAPPADLPALARGYAERIRAVQPHGPYQLLGWSFGGLAAYAVAAQLEAEGERVALLALLDGYPVLDPAGRPLLPPGGEHDEDFDADLPDWEDDGALDFLHEAIGGVDGLAPDELPLVLRAMTYHRELRHTYRPPRYHGDILFFTAAADRPAGAPTAEVWTSFTDATVDNVPVDCRHARMLDAEPLAVIGKTVGEVLRTAAALPAGAGDVR
ncbi:amino acid adenylation domain-containing protein [Streptomyces sp. SL13]|uniref:Amino acid adenylation domain-containing protein n=1 Tax=Streptantibioticus silvisoli TaxID=2705255 RepID=A0AA90KCB5_9ACTN|nr:non-ribosomal peptide synthetase [Streptantibioticus silvisoli]MDI5974277.1 amino acid adenylation domain-containing protein [Streptantibioticus silvisoli]